MIAPQNLVKRMKTERNFRHLLDAQWRDGKFLCICLDPVQKRIVRGDEPISAQYELSCLKQIVDGTKHVAAAFMPKHAVHHGLAGDKTLKQLIDYIHSEAPDVPVILDCGADDIEYSARGWVFDHFNADAITVYGYLGCEAVERKGTNLFFLCQTSNPETADPKNRFAVVSVMEMVQLTQESANAVRRNFKEHSEHEIVLPVDQLVALQVAALANKQCGLIVGATAPLEQARKLAPDLPILIQDIGKQDGQIKKIVRAAGDKFLISSSLDNLYVFDEAPGQDIAITAGGKADELHHRILGATRS